MKNIEFTPGAITPKVHPLSYEFGGMTPIKETLLFPNNSVTEWLSTDPFVQRGVYFDTWGCVGHSLINSVQILIHRQLAQFSPANKAWAMRELYKDDYPYLSHRDLVVLSETVHGRGNTGMKVLATAEKQGVVIDELAPWNMRERDPEVNSLEKYFLYGRTPEAKEFAREFNERLEITGEWTYRNGWEQASKYGVLQMYVNAWHQRDGVYFNPTGRTNHAVIMEDYNKTTIFDTYNPFTKKLRSWDDAHQVALKINLIEKHMEKLNIPNNTLLILVEAPGGIGLFLDGKIIIDDEAKINSVFMARNSKNNFFTGGPTMSLTLEQWQSFPHINLRGEDL